MGQVVDDEGGRLASELERHQDLLRLAGELLGVGGWAMEVPSGELTWTDGIHRILDVPRGQAPPPVEEVIARYPPADRQRLTTALDAVAEHGTPFDLALEVDTFAGRRRQVRAVGEARRDDAGTIRRVVGAFQDVSDLHRATEEAAALGRRLADALESMTDAVFTLDRAWRIGFVNGRGVELLQRAAADDLVGRDLWEEFPEAVGTEVHEAYHRAMAEQVTVSVDDFHYPPLATWFSIRAYPTRAG
jgi:PAS domain-containing protein